MLESFFDLPIRAENVNHTDSRILQSTQFTEVGETTAAFNILVFKHWTSMTFETIVFVARRKLKDRANQNEPYQIFGFWTVPLAGPELDAYWGDILVILSYEPTVVVRWLCVAEQECLPPERSTNDLIDDTQSRFVEHLAVRATRCMFTTYT